MGKDDDALWGEGGFRRRIGDEDDSSSTGTATTPPPLRQRQSEGERSGCGCWVWMLTIIGTALLGCCGACGVVGYLFMPKIFDQPQQVTKLASEMVDAAWPASWQPAVGLEINNFIMRTRLVQFERPATGGQALLMTLKARNPQLRQAFEQAMEEQHAEMRLEVQKAEAKPITIAGRVVPVEYLTGTDEDGQLMHQVRATVPYRDGTLLIIIQQPNEELDETEVTGFLESIKP